jgi:hypothetical protein
MGAATAGSMPTPTRPLPGRGTNPRLRDATVQLKAAAAREREEQEAARRRWTTLLGAALAALAVGFVVGFAARLSLLLLSPLLLLLLLLRLRAPPQALAPSQESTCGRTSKQPKPPGLPRVHLRLHEQRAPAPNPPWPLHHLSGQLNYG